MPLVKVEKAMFEGLVSHFEHIFVLLTILKCDFVEVEKSRSRMAFSTYFRLLEQHKI